MSKTLEFINGVSSGIDKGIESFKDKPAQYILAGVAAVAIVVGANSGLIPNSVKPAKASDLTDYAKESAAATSSATQAETSSNNATEAEQSVEAAKTKNVDVLVAKGASQEAAVAVIKQETQVFFGGDRGEIVGQRPDGACIVATQEGKTVEEFTKTELAVGQTPEQAKEALVAGLCNGENGVNVPAVASFMAQIEAMKNDININADFDKVYTEMVQKYIDAMQESPDAAQAYLETVKAHFANATIGNVEDISGREDHTIYTHDGGEDLTIFALNVHNRPGTAGVTVTFHTKNSKGVEVTQAIQVGECLQVRIGNEIVKITPPKAEKPPVATPPAQPAQPVAKPPVVRPPKFEAQASVCVGLDDDGNEINKYFHGEGETQEEAQEAADQAAQAATGDCTPGETSTSTSTSTTVPTTIRVTTTATTMTIPVTTIPVTTAPDKVTIPTVPQPSDPPTTVAEPTVPDDTRPDATVAGTAAPSPSIPQQAGDAVGGVVNNAANHPQGAASSFVGVGALIGYIKKERNKRKGKKS